MRVYLSFASLLVLSACAASPVQETPPTDDYQPISFEGEAATPLARRAASSSTPFAARGECASRLSSVR